ncbi:hypothetical protein [Thermostichus sp. MS-CIW-25]
MDEHLQELLRQEDQKRADAEIRRTYALSQKSQGVAIFLSILLAFAAYIYTRRWKALMVFLGWCFFLGVLFSDDEGEVSLPGLFLASTWAAVDNCGAIQRAKEEIERLRSGQNPDVDRQT